MSSRAPGTTAHPGPPRAPQPGDDDDDVMAAPAAAAAAAAPPDGLIVDTVVELTPAEKQRRFLVLGQDTNQSYLTELRGGMMAANTTNVAVPGFGNMDARNFHCRAPVIER
jgi:hypothetical protein